MRRNGLSKLSRVAAVACVTKALVTLLGLFPFLSHQLLSRLVQHPASARRHLVSKPSCPGSVGNNGHSRGVRTLVYRNTIANKEIRYEGG